MALQYTLGYPEASRLVDEKFVRESVSEAFVNRDYSFVGVNSIRLYGVETVALTNYNRATGFGTPSTPNTTQQEFAMTQDKKFSVILDNVDVEETGGALDPSMWLARQVRERVVPEIDTYRFGVMAAANGVTTVTAATTKANVYEQITDATASQDENDVPESGRVLGATTATYQKLKLSDDFTKNRDIAVPLTINSVVGEVDGMPVVKINTNRLPANVNFFVAHPVATIAPIKLTNYKINPDPDMYDGTLVTGRIYYDAFVLTNKAKAIYFHKEQ